LSSNATELWSGYGDSETEQHPHRHSGSGFCWAASSEPSCASRACGPEACQPRLLAVDDGRFADAVAACLLFASVGMQDCYLADAGAAVVYLAYHHDQIVVSIPDVSARENLLKQLQDAAWLFADVSGFASLTDDDEDTSDAP
jgi:hypothetical protein